MIYKSSPSPNYETPLETMVFHRGFRPVWGHRMWVFHTRRMGFSIIILSYHYLVGGFNPSEKILVSWDDYSRFMQK